MKWVFLLLGAWLVEIPYNAFHHQWAMMIVGLVGILCVWCSGWMFIQEEQKSYEQALEKRVRIMTLALQDILEEQVHDGHGVKDLENELTSALRNIAHETLDTVCDTERK